MPLDIRSLLLVITLLLVGRAFALLLAYRLQRHYPPLRYWVLGSSLVAAGSLLVGMRGVIGLPLSVLAGQALVLSGWALMDLGTMRAAGCRPPVRAFAMAVGATLVGLAWFLWGQDNYQMRSVLTTVASVGMDVLAATCCLRRRSASSPRHITLRWLGALLLLLAVSNVLKLWFVLEYSEAVLLVQDWRNVQFYLCVAVYCVLHTALCILLAAQRVEDRLGSALQAQTLAQEQVRSMAYFDPLTRLPNRRLLNDRLEQSISQARRTHRYGSVLMLDLDNFKSLNDNHGHAAGDLLLQEVAARLTTCLRAVDTASRVGGDEFVVVLSALAEQEADARAQALAVAEKVRVLLAQTYVLTPAAGAANIEHHCTASIGVTVFCDGAPGEVLHHADQAMYAAKNAGRNAVRLYAG